MGLGCRSTGARTHARQGRLKVKRLHFTPPNLRHRMAPMMQSHCCHRGAEPRRPPSTVRPGCLSERCTVPFATVPCSVAALVPRPCARKGAAHSRGPTVPDTRARSRCWLVSWITVSAIAQTLGPHSLLGVYELFFNCLPSHVHSHTLHSRLFSPLPSDLHQ